MAIVKMEVNPLLVSETDVTNTLQLAPWYQNKTLVIKVISGTLKVNTEVEDYTKSPDYTADDSHPLLLAPSGGNVYFTNATFKAEVV